MPLAEQNKQNSRDRSGNCEGNGTAQELKNTGSVRPCRRSSHVASYGRRLPAKTSLTVQEGAVVLGLHLRLHLLSILSRTCESVKLNPTVPHSQNSIHTLQNVNLSRRRHCQKQRPGSKAGVLQCLGYSFAQPIFQIRRMESQASPTEATHGQRHSKAQKDPWRTPES